MQELQESNTQQEQGEQHSLLMQSLQKQIQNPSKYQSINNLCLVLKLLQNKTQFAVFQDFDYIDQHIEKYRRITRTFRFTNISDKNFWNKEYVGYQLYLNGYSYDKKLQCLQKIKVRAHTLDKLDPIKHYLNVQEQQQIEQLIQNPTWIQQHTSMRLFKCNQLPLPENHRQQLINLLNKRADITQDFNETCPVQDIVDPELNPNYSYQNYGSYKKQQLIPENSESGYSSYEDDVEANFYIDEWQDLEETEQEYESLRSQYQWIPTIFRVDKDSNKAEIIGEIHNLPRKGNEELYSILEEVFMLQLPMFRKVECLKQVTDFQVVFKAQKYLIKPLQQYEGKWHLEGKTENIKAASVYYIDIDEGFQLDELNFKNLGNDESEYLDQVDVDIQKQCCLVFENNIPHKFNALMNTTDKTLNRLFMNFFIINPETPISLTESDIQEILYTISIKLNINTASIIMRFLGFNQSIEIAKKQRLQMRQSSHKEINGWGYIFYGNNGGLKYVDTFHTDRKYRYALSDYKQDIDSD